MLKTNNTGCGCATIVLVLIAIFITLKLTAWIAWSWWWVLSPAAIYLIPILGIGTLFLLSLTIPNARLTVKKTKNE